MDDSEEEEEEPPEGDEDEGEFTAHEKMFACGVCGHKVPSGRKTFDLEDLGAKSWCGRCRKSHDSQRWRGSCAKEWSACKVHKKVPKYCRRMAKVREEGGNKTKRKRVEGEVIPLETRVSELCVEKNISFRRADCDVVAEKGIRSSMLSAALKRKFHHLCTE